MVWIENPRGSFLADPCILHWNNKAYIYVEQYFYKAESVISLIILDVDDTYSFNENILEESFHLSFPSL